MGFSEEERAREERNEGEESISFSSSSSKRERRVERGFFSPFFSPRVRDIPLLATPSASNLPPLFFHSHAALSLPNRRARGASSQLSLDLLSRAVLFSPA